jgi:hypothetical protein
MASAWFYEHNGKEIGPVTSSELKALAASGRLEPTHLVWKEGLDQWLPAGKLPGLYGNAPASGGLAESHAGLPSPADTQVATAPTRIVMASSSAASSRGPNASRAPSTTSTDTVPAKAPKIQRVATAARAAAASGAPIPLEDAPATSSNADRQAPSRPLNKAKLSNDTGPVKEMGKSFAYGAMNWKGSAILSPKAVYLIKVAPAGGAAKRSNDDVRTCAARELPLAVQALLEPSQVESADAIVLPKTATSFVKLGSSVCITCGGDRFSITPDTMGKAKTREALVQMSWHPGHEMTPSTSAMHGESLAGVTADPGGGSKSPMLWIVLGVIILIAIAAVIVLKMKSH